MYMTSQVVFTIDSKIKAKAMKRAKAEGIPFASFLKMATEKYAEGKLGVGIIEEKFNQKTSQELKAILKDVTEGKNLSPAFTNMDDAIEWLDHKD